VLQTKNYAKQTQFRIPARRESAKNHRLFSKNFQKFLTFPPKKNRLYRLDYHKSTPFYAKQTQSGIGIYPGAPGPSREFSKNFSFSAPSQKPLIPPRLPHNHDLFMQNKPNFPSAKMNVTTVLTKEYQNIYPHSPLQNKPNHTHHLRSAQPTIKMQNKPNFAKARIHLTPYGHMDYEKSHFPEPRKNKPNQPNHPRTMQPTIKMQNKPNFPNAKMNLTIYGTRNYQNIRLREPRKNKPIWDPGAPGMENPRLLYTQDAPGSFREAKKPYFALARAMARMLDCSHPKSTACQRKLE